MKAIFAFVRRINLRHWSQHRLRTSLTVLGVAVGVMLVVAVASVNATLLTAVEDTAKRLGANAELEVAAPDRTGMDAGVVRKIAATDGVESAVPVLRSYARIDRSDRQVRTLILGVDPSFGTLLSDFTDEELSITDVKNMHDGLFLSSRTGETLGVEVGDSVEVETYAGKQRLVIGGFFSGTSVDSLGAGDVGVMALPAAQQIFGRGGNIDSVYVLAAPGRDEGVIQRSLERSLPGGTIIGPPGQRAQGFDDALNGIAALSSLAGTVALFVAAFVVFNSVGMSVRERRREISLSLALGATRRQVLAGFVGETAVLGAIACVLGVSAGYLLAQELIRPSLDGLRVFSITAVADPSFGWSEALLGIAAGLGVSIAASYLPARRIMKVAPVESLRPAAPYDDRTDRLGGVARIGVLVTGVVILAGSVAFGLLRTSDLDNAAWTTSVSLVFLLLGTTLVLPSVVPPIVRVLRRVFGRNVSTRLGLDSLQRNPRRTTLTIGALVFTLGIVVGVGGALDSYEAQWWRSATEWHAGPIHVVPESFETLGADQPLAASFGGVLRSVPGVANVYPTRYRIVYVDGRQTTIYAASYAEANDDPAVRASGGQPFRDGMARVERRGEVVVSALMAEKRSIDVGDEIVLPTPSGDATFKVGGIMHDLNPLDSVSMGGSMFVEHWKDERVDSFAVTPAPGTSVEEAVVALQSAIEDLDVPAVVRTKDEMIQQAFAPIAELFSIARAIQLAALIVAALAIANTMFVTVLERRWELGLQKAVGMDARSVVKMLLVEAGAIGLIGSILAWLAGLGMGYLMVSDMESSYSFSFPFEIPFDLMLLTLFLGSAIALLAGAVPSRKALRMPIVESLRFE